MQETLRKLAAELREKAKSAEAEKNIKVAQVRTAAKGLQYLKAKLGL